MELEADRRRFLELAGTGTALSLAGCSALQDASESQGTAGTGTAPGDSPSKATVAVAVQADQATLRKRREKIQSELSSGNVSRSEAQKRYQTAQTELRSEAVDSFRERASSSDSMEVVGAVERFGILLVSGSTNALVGSLSAGEVNALLPEQTFQRAQAQQGTTTADSPSSTSTSSN